MLVSDPEFTGDLIGKGFREGSIDPDIDSVTLPHNIKYFGSWSVSHHSMGTAYSQWYHVAKSFCFMVSGYPCFGKNSLLIELKNRKGNLSAIRLKDINPGKKWVMIKISATGGDGPHRIRFIMKDGEKGAFGWLGISQPFEEILGPGSTFMTLFRILLTVVTSIVLLFGPGFLLRATVKNSSPLLNSLILITLPGFFYLTITGLITWALATTVDPHLTVTILISPIIILCLFVSLKKSIYDITTPVESQALIIFFVVVLIAVAKATYSLGPAGELYGGTVSRTLEVGARSDSRISYHGVQLVANGIKPYSAVGSRFFLPWSYSHRGPIAGLASSPLVILSGAHVTKDMPDQPWHPFDPEGFASYRIIMIVMAATSLLALFSVTSSLLNTQAGLFITALACTSPFILHEIYFTWPKLQATVFVLIALHLLFMRRFVWTGISLGIGYLLHPIALFYSPIIWFIWLILILRTKPQNKSSNIVLPLLSYPEGQRIIRNSFQMFLALGLIILMWWTINAGHNQQTDFFKYFIKADGDHVSSFSEWIRGRADSIANTIIPFNLFFFHSHHPSANSIFGKSPDTIVFFLQYWTSIPFGMGLLCFPLLLVQFYRGVKKFPIEFIVTVFVPFLIFSIYWGGAITGMMREGLHVWVFCLLLFITWSYVSGSKGEISIANWQSALISFRAAEIVFMLLLPSLISKKVIFQEQYFLSDLVQLGIIIIGVIWLGKRCYVIMRTPILIQKNPVYTENYLKNNLNTLSIRI
jgi:hypothetical protein